MKCKNSENAMMEYIDGIIKPKKAASLARHVLVCKNCREYFMLFDEAAKYDITEAPDDFTAAVMQKVKNEPPHKPPAFNKPDFIIRLYSGITAIILGAALAIMYSQDGALEFFSRFAPLTRAAEIVTGALAAVTRFFNESILGMGIDAAETPLGSGQSLAALFFVVIIAAILFVLRRDEKVKS